MLQIYRMLCTTIHNLFKQHFVSWNELLLNSTYELQIPTEGREPGGAGISHKNLWLVVPKSAISGHSSPPNAQIGASNPLFPDQDQAKICLSNPLSPGQGSAGASRGLLQPNFDEEKRQLRFTPHPGSALIYPVLALKIQT